MLLILICFFYLKIFLLIFMAILVLWIYLDIFIFPHLFLMLQTFFSPSLIFSFLLKLFTMKMLQKKILH